ncbi:MAG: 3-phosphoshikimate 1-carboxyvinyltransferase [Gammaproteobacteria bacterium]
MHIRSTKTHSLQGVITPPASKSEAIRALIFALLSSGTSSIHQMLDADDITEVIHACQTMGAIIQRSGSTLTLTSSGAPFTPGQSRLTTGNSGLTTRLILPLLGLRTNASNPMVLDCGMQMRARPMAALISALNQLGMQISSTEWPLTVTGTLTGGSATLSEPISQFFSALLMALPLAPKSSTITVGKIPAWSYVEMTFAWLNRLGIDYKHYQENNLNTIIIPGNQQYKPFEYTLSGDFSSASYFIAAATVLPGTVRIKGLDKNDTQGDKQLIPIIQQMGGDISYDGSDIIIVGGKPLKGIRIDASNIPDLLPTLAVLGTVASGKTEIINVAQARLKETDRIHSMTDGLTHMGARIDEKNDGMTIYPSALIGTTVKGYGDHRTVMSLALAGLLAEGTTVIDEAESIGKTFPQFTSEMKSLGANMELTP